MISNRIKYCFSCILMLCFLHGTLAQTGPSYLCNESFSSKIPQGWSIQPAFSASNPTWKTDTGTVLSAKYAMHGYAPFMSGDTAELVTPFFDCSSYPYVTLRFSHICKILPSDICEIQYQEQGLGANYKWKNIPKDAYMGTCTLYPTDLNFSHKSYGNWKSNDTLAQPNAGWYRQEIFDLSNYASYAKVRFRFLIRKGNYFSSYIAAGWYVDDFQLLVSKFPIKPPVVEFRNAPQDTLYSTGPYVVEAKVATRSGIGVVPPVLECRFTHNSTVTKSQLPMSRLSGDSIWTVTIPRQEYGTSVSYSINGSDSAGNTALATQSFHAKRSSSIKDSNSVAMVSIDRPSKSEVPGLQAVSITLINKGIKNLTSATVNWKVNNVLQTPKTYTGNLPCDFTDTLELGTYTQRAGIFDTISVWVSMPNNTADPVQNDDSKSICTYGCDRMHGTYTIGKSDNQHHCDFASFNEFANLMNQCGMAGDVTLELATGVYASSIDVSVFGNQPYRITIASQAKNADSVVFRPASGYVANLIGRQKLGFRNITLDAGTSRSNAIRFGNGSKDIEFVHCRITGPEIVIFQQNSGSISDIRFTGNDITGEVNICGASNQRNAGIVFDSNRVTTVTTGHKYGIRLEYVNRATISHNFIQDANTSMKDFDGISVYQSDTCFIHSNRILGRGNAYDYQHGIYCYYLDAHSVIYNNEIIMHGTGSVYGCCIEYPSGTKIINNSILVSGKSSRTYGGLYVTGNFQCEVKNNICVARGATYSYPMYITSASSLGQCNVDYNCLWGDNYTGYVGSAKTSLSAYQTALPSAVHDIWQRPLYIDSTLSLELSYYSNVICPRHASVSTDIKGEQRTALTPMGAYGVKLYDGVNLSLLEFTEPQTDGDIVCYPDNTPVSIVFSNSGIKSVDFKTYPLKISLDVTGAVRFHYDTVLTSGTLDFMQRDTLRLTRIPTLANGVYDIRVSLYNTADKTADDDTLSLAYRSYRIGLPYDVDFSQKPGELLNRTMTGETEWEVMPGGSRTPALAPAFGKGSLFFEGYGKPGNSCNAIFNSINIRGCTNPTLSFWYAHNAACSGFDMLMVFVSTDGGANLTEIKRIMVTDTATAWKRYDIDLTPFNNCECLSLIFRAVSFGGSNQAIDRIRITADKDAALELLPVDLAARAACDHSPVDIKAIVRNTTNTSIELFNDTITLNVTGASNFTFRLPYHRKLGGLESDTVTLGQINLSLNGYTYLQAYMQSLDDNTSNDTAVDSTLYVMQDMAIDSIIGIDEQAFKLAGEKVKVSAVAVNSGNVTADRVLFRMNLDGNEVVTDTVFSPMKPGDTLVHAMSRTYTVPGVSKDQPYYFLEVRVELDCDGNTDNDSISLVCNVMIPDSTDIQVLDITATSPAKGKTKVAPSVRIANIGNQEADNVVLHVDVIDSAKKVVESISEMVSHLAINETKVFAFTMNYTVPDYTGKYTLRAYVEKQQADYNQSNDTLSKVFENIMEDTRISESEGLNWSLGQNIPNPAAGITRIPFSLPQDGEAVFSVMGANGQQIYRETIRTEAGQHSVEFNVSDLAAGIYYYSMEYNGQRIVRKMSVAR